MDHDHAEGEVGKVDEDNEAEVHRKKSEPDPGAGFAKKSEREIEEFGEESAPGHDADKTFGETQDEVAEGAGAGEGIVEDVGDGGAIDPWVFDLTPMVLPKGARASLEWPGAGPIQRW